MKRTSFLVAGIILAGVCTAWLFTPSVSERIAAALKKFNEEFPQEKVYVHTDRPYYLAGETIWFKAYLTAGSFHQLSPLSKTLYVELVNEKKEKIMQLMVRLNEGTGHADILLPSDLKSGNYLLRAYTNWMRNYDEDFFYNQEIKIWNIDEKISQPPVVALEPVDLQFFPEGGHLVSGIKSNIAFKAVGSDGLGKKVKGKIYSASGTVEAEFESTHLGMGMFSFTPEQGQHYTAEIEDMNQMEAQKALKYDLPTVEDRGFVITVTNKEDQEEVVVKIQSTESTPRPQTLTLAAHHRGELSFVAQVNFANVIYFVKMPKANLLHGLTHITLFDGTGRPLCNRLIFIDKAGQMRVTIKGLKPAYKPREKVEFEIETKDAEGKPLPAQLSLTAVNTGEVAIDAYGKSIVDYLQLSSDLRGHIENPGYYFHAAEPDRYKNLDLLLLTQGWTRFAWEKILQDQWPAITHYIEQGINIQGALLDDLSGAPVEGGKVTFFTTSNETDIVVAATGKKGRFIFDDLIFYDSSKVVLQGENKRGKKFVKFEVDPLLPNQPVSYPLQPIKEPISDYENTLVVKGEERRKIDASYQFEGKTIVLEGVEVRGERIDPDKEARVYKGVSKTIKADQVPGYNYLFHPLELLRGVAGVRLLPNPPGYDVVIRGIGTFTGNTSPLIMLDNVPVAINTLNTIPVSMIESVDVFRGAEATVFGSQGANGVIAFFTRKGGSVASIAKGVFNVNLKGYYSAQEFYSPKYDINKPEHVKPDRRVTVFWQPQITTNENGKATVHFFNPDPETSVFIQVEGITKSGIPGKGTATYRLGN
jgi:hypothetical protein